MTRSRRGFALLSVLWCVGLLAAIAAVILRSAHSDMQRAQVDLALAQAQATADGAVRLAILGALAANDASGWDGTPRPYGAAVVAMQDESGLVDLNSASSVLLSGLLRQAGTAPNAIEPLAAAIVAARGNPPVITPFFSTLDLLRVPGFGAPLVRRLAPMVTVYSGQTGIDPRNAPAALIDALPAPDSPEGKPLVQKSRHDGVRIAAKAMVDGVTAWRVSDVRIGHLGGSPYRILTWTTEAPG